MLGIALFMLALLSESWSGRGYLIRPTIAGSLKMSADTMPSPMSAPSSVYINLPFCRRRCFYCDFPIKVVGDRPGAAEHAAKPYVDRVVQEIRATAAVLDRSHRRTVSPADRPPHSSEESDVRDSKGEHKVVNTLFFGGGTPSLCPPELVGLLIDTVQDCLGIASGAEISIEMDPGTFDEERLKRFLDLGINRVSMGVQSFDAELLKSCGRAHSLQDVYDAVAVLQRAGVKNFSIDLMSGLPRQTNKQWEYTLKKAISTDAAHISVYDLQVEAGTAFGRWFTAGEAPLPQEDNCADMYRTASRVLGAAGYEHYEISNYARPGFQSRHNRAYWENVPFLAFGNGAASYVDGHRFSRPRGLSEYDKWVDKLTHEGWSEATSTGAQVLPTVGAGILAGDDGPSDEAAERDALMDDVMLGFRLKEGLDLDTVASKYGERAARVVEIGASEGLHCGWVFHEDRDGGVRMSGGDDAVRNRGFSTVDSSIGLDVFGKRVDGIDVRETKEERRSDTSSSGRGTLRLSDPEGFLFSNSVISSIFCELDGWSRSREDAGSEHLESSSR